MASKNYKSELDDVFKKFNVFAKARQHLRHEEGKISDATKASINNSVSASGASGEKRQELLSDARENADKAAEILLQLHHRLIDDFGRFWRQDLITQQQYGIPEQEIPTRTITFRMREPDEYGKIKASLTVSGQPYVFGLLDCVGELDRILHDSLKNNQKKFLKQILKKMEEMYTKLERFKEFPNRKDPLIKTKDLANLKHRIDVCGGQVHRCRTLLQNKGIL